MMAALHFSLRTTSFKLTLFGTTCTCTAEVMLVLVDQVITSHQLVV